jgi:hypothetical protein
METGVESKTSDRWRTPTAIGVAAAIGAPIGVFLHMTAVPFGPVLYGWFVALAGAIIVPGGLCFLATHRYALVRFAYAAGVSTGAVATGLIAPRGDLEFWWVPLQFMIIFGVVCSVSLMAAGFWAVLNWADERFRKWEGPIE